MGNFKHIILPIIVAGMVVTSAIGAGLSNPGFEAGDLSSWTVEAPSGSVSVVTNALGWVASEGTYFALIESGPNENTDFTVLKQSFDLQEGDVVCFDYFFQSSLDRPEILARAILSSSGQGGFSEVKLKGGVDDSVIGEWTTAYTDPIKKDKDGEYTLLFKVKNQTSSEYVTTFGIDNISDECEVPPEDPIAEPITILASLMGLFSLGGYARVKRS